jgi:hypothetical protein
MYQIELNNNFFLDSVERVLSENLDIEEIIETGTHVGMGSTKIWANTGLPVKTIEVNPEYWTQAVNNLKEFTNVEPFLGASLPISRMEQFIQENKEYYDSASQKNIGCEGPDAVSFYLAEVNGGGFSGSFKNKPKSENLLFKLINNSKKQLIFLDSAGGIGFLEYQEVMSLKKEYLRNKILFLDDINHVKHHRSVKSLKDKGYDVVENEDGRSAYCYLCN